jgi:hypothetical protein
MLSILGINAYHGNAERVEMQKGSVVNSQVFGESGATEILKKLGPIPLGQVWPMRIPPRAVLHMNFVSPAK